MADAAHVGLFGFGKLLDGTAGGPRLVENERGAEVFDDARVLVAGRFGVEIERAVDGDAEKFLRQDAGAAMGTVEQFAVVITASHEPDVLLSGAADVLSRVEMAGLNDSHRSLTPLGPVSSARGAICPTRSPPSRARPRGPGRRPRTRARGRAP